MTEPLISFMEYQAELEKKLNAFERLTDKLTGVDDRLDVLVRLQIEQLRLFKITQRPLSQGESREIRVQETVAALTGIRVENKCPFPSGAIITSITFHFPSGCDGLVDVRAGYGTIQWFPRENYISLDNATPTFPTLEILERDNPLWTEIRNADTAYSHTITVIYTLQNRIG